MKGILIIPISEGQLKASWSLPCRMVHERHLDDSHIWPSIKGILIIPISGRLLIPIFDGPLKASWSFLYLAAHWRHPDNSHILPSSLPSYSFPYLVIGPKKAFCSFPYLVIDPIYQIVKASLSFLYLVSSPMYFHLPFSAHLSWKLRWTFLIACCLLSIYLLSVNFSYFHLLLQNYWGNFNQTWHKAPNSRCNMCNV